MFMAVKEMLMRKYEKEEHLEMCGSYVEPIVNKIAVVLNSL